MISFWVDQPGSFTITNYLSSRGAQIADRFAVRYYDQLGPGLELLRGPHVLSALDQVTPAQLEAVRSIAEQLRAADVAVLNHPGRVRFRPELLRSLAREGLNDYDVHRADESKEAVRFPVFVREAHNHTGNQTGLIHSSRDLEHALAMLRLRGHRLRDLLVVEFCDTADDLGVYRKYAAFKVGDAIVPAHMMAGDHWMIKSSGDQPTVEIAEEALRYVEENPHEEWLRKVFTIAGADYGRIDYGVLKGRPQAWEVNLNPTVGRAPGKPPRDLPPEVAEIRNRAREGVHQRLRAAFARLDQQREGEPIAVRLDPPLLQAITAETARVRRRRSVLGVLQRLYEHPWAGRPFRTVYTKFFTRV